MTQILNISRTEDGQFQISDASGHLVEGPFDTNSAAWKALDRLDNDNSNRPDKQHSNKPVLWGLGTFGAASDVKRIDPAVYLAEKAARGEL